MKKSNLFKAVGIVILSYVLLSWIIPIINSIGGFKWKVSNQLGFVSTVFNVLNSLPTFIPVITFVLLVGAFYGVLKATGAYDKIIDLFSSKVVGREKLLLILVIILMALVSSVVGLDLGLLIVFPILIGLLVKVGYDKMVALSATLGATIIGMYGATFSISLYGVNNQILDLKTFNQIIPKVVFFVLGLAGLIAFVLMYCKKNGLPASNKGDNMEVKVSSKKSDKVKKSSVKRGKDRKSKGVKKALKIHKERGERSAVPALIVIGIMILIALLGTTNWSGLIGSENWFATAHSAWTGFTIGKFDLLNKLFGLENIGAFGTWAEPTIRFQVYSILLIYAMIIISLLYRTKFEDSFDGFVDGLKSFIVPAVLVVLALSLHLFVYFNDVLTPVMNALLKSTKEFNVAISGIYIIINSLFYVDYYYFASFIVYPITQVYEDKSVLSILSVMFANLYSLVMLVAPSSVLLLVSLSISEVKYKDWLKFIWKFALGLLLVSFVVFTIMLLV